MDFTSFLTLDVSPSEHRSVFETCKVRSEASGTKPSCHSWVSGLGYLYTYAQMYLVYEIPIVKVLVKYNLIYNPFRLRFGNNSVFVLCISIGRIKKEGSGSDGSAGTLNPALGTSRSGQ